MKINNETECHGCDCFKKINDKIDCELTIDEDKQLRKKIIKGCPCRICLVKRNCSKACPEFKKHFQGHVLI